MIHLSWGVSKLKRLVSTFANDESGNFATMSALIFPLMLGVAALAVDEGSLYLQRRNLQTAVDMATIYAAGDPANAAERARRVLIDHKIYSESDTLSALTTGANPRLRVTNGTYAANSTVAVEQRFQPSMAGAGANAVKVHATDLGDVYFARQFLGGRPLMTAQAVASSWQETSFSIGTRLASINEGALNALLSSLLGANLNLSLMDYQSLASLDVNVLEFLDELGLRVGLTAGTYQQLLNTEVGVAQVVAALGAVAAGQSAHTANILLNIANKVGAGVKIPMIRVIGLDRLADVGVGGANAALDATVNLLQLLQTTATLSDGQNQAAVGLNLGLPGLTSLSAKVAVGEKQQSTWYRVGGVGSYVRTAQTRVLLDVGLLGGSTKSGLSLISIADLNVPVYAELAHAEARVSSIQCFADRSQNRVTLSVTPGLLRLIIGKINPANFQQTNAPISYTPAEIARVLGVGSFSTVLVTAESDVKMSNITPKSVTFTQADIDNKVVKTVSTTTPLTSLIRSLTSNIELRLKLLDGTFLGGVLDFLLTPLLNAVLALVATLLLPLAGILDVVLMLVFNILGLSVGQVDVEVHSIGCQPPSLVQ